MLKIFNLMFSSLKEIKMIKNIINCTSNKIVIKILWISIKIKTANNHKLILIIIIIIINNYNINKILLI